MTRLTKGVFVMPSVQAPAEKSGYLHENFRIFHNADSRKREIPFHYHDFHKLVFFLSGNVRYVVEGRQYDLRPLDLVPVAAGQIHRPVIRDDSLYERIIIYISPVFFRRYTEEDTDLFYCFSGCMESHSNLIRSGEAGIQSLSRLAKEMKICAYDTGYGSSLLRRIRLLELLLLACRILRMESSEEALESASHPVIVQAIDFIGRNLFDEHLCVDLIASETSMNRSYLMHLFREQTGYTIGGYITEKRLFHARRLIEQGIPVTQACYQSGFGSYAAFYHAYRKKYAAAPAHGLSRQVSVEDE